MILGDEARPQEQYESLKMDPRRSWKLWYLNKTYGQNIYFWFCSWYVFYYSAYRNYEDIVTLSEGGKV